MKADEMNCKKEEEYNSFCTNTREDWNEEQYQKLNGSSGNRKEMLGRFRAYLDAFYPDFTDTERKYDKWSFLKEKPYV